MSLLNRFRKRRPLVRYTAQVDRGCAVEFRWFGGMDMRVSWAPKRPKRIEGDVLARYRAARDEYLREVGRFIGGDPATIAATIDELRKLQDPLDPNRSTTEVTTP